MDEETQRMRRVVEDVFRAVWNEHYDWEQSSCTDVLSNLNGQDVPNQDGNELEAVMAQTSNPPPANSLAEDLFTHEYVVFEPNASTSDIKQSELVAVPSHGFVPSDPYEACVPAQRLVLHGDDPNDMPYVPYADDDQTSRPLLQWMKMK
ncbi:hypothetical protein EIP86_008556 [Pleurotus ostreatoroseus]|nr:hypothetical protein EIP86_008556 [Pleurotus ostreatoroseus]